MRKIKITLGNSSLQQRIKEIPMPHELLEQLYDDSRRLGYETEEEVEYRDKKEVYNLSLLKKIKRMKRKDPLRSYFTDKQIVIFNYLFIDGLTLAEAAKKLSISIGTVMDIKKAIIKKVKKNIKYEFK